MDPAAVLQDYSANLRRAPMDRAHEIRTFALAAVPDSIHASTTPSSPEGHSVSRVQTHQRDKAQPGGPDWRTKRSSHRPHRKWPPVDKAFQRSAAWSSRDAGRSATSCRGFRCARLQDVRIGDVGWGWAGHDPRTHCNTSSAGVESCGLPPRLMSVKRTKKSVTIRVGLGFFLP